MEPVGPPIRSYADLHHFLRARAEQLNVSRQEIARVGGLTEGYAAKLLSPRPMKKLGVTSFALILGALGVHLLPVEDPEAMRRISRMAEKRVPLRAMHAGTVHIKFSRRFLRKIQRKGGENSRKYMSAQKRRSLARKAALIRWADVKAAARSTTGNGSTGMPSNGR
jgi:hypothetical protein